MIAHTVRSLPHGIDLSCRTCGPDDGRLLVFLHGFPEAAFVWDKVMHHFAQPANGGYRCVAPNLRGYEQSSAPAEVSAYRAKHLVQDVAALIDIERAVDGQPLAALVGHDWGGAVAWSLAAMHPELIPRLVIINSPHPATFLRDLKASPTQQAASAYMNDLRRPGFESELAKDDYRFLRQLLGPLDAEEAEAYRACWAHGLTGGCKYYRASPLHPDTPDAPGKIAAIAALLNPEDFHVTVPTQVIWGTGDVALRPVLLEGLGQHVSDLRVHRIEGAGHWVTRQNADEVNRVIQAFLADALARER